MDLPRFLGDLVRSLGFVVDEPVALRSTHNTVLWLAPSPVVAKVAADRARAIRELDVVRQLAELGAPVVPPIALGPQPIACEAGTITLWRYVSQQGVDELGSPAIARQLHVLHQRLRAVDLPGRVPRLEETVQAALDALDRSDVAPELATADRTMLRRALLHGRAELQRGDLVRQLIHGAPHRRNVLVADGHPRFIDFEDVTFGPREWDLAHLEGAAADPYGDDLDRELLTVCRLTVSAATATWCWRDVARGADMRDHAEHHLEVVRAGAP